MKDFLAAIFGFSATSPRFPLYLHLIQYSCKTINHFCAVCAVNKSVNKTNFKFNAIVARWLVLPNRRVDEQSVVGPVVSIGTDLCNVLVFPQLGDVS